MRIANLQVNLTIGMHTCKEESHHSDFWSTHNHNPKGIKDNPRIFNCLHMIQMVVRNKESCKEQKLEALPDGELLPSFLRRRVYAQWTIGQWKSLYNDINRWTTGEEIIIWTFMLCSCRPATRINLTQVSKVTPWCSYRSFGLFLFPKNKILQNLELYCTTVWVCY